MFTDICQKVFDFFTIFADLIIRYPVEDKALLFFVCFLSIAFVTILLGSFGMFLLETSHDGKNQARNIFKFAAGSATLGAAVLGALLSLLLLSKPDVQNVLPTIKPIESLKNPSASPVSESIAKKPQM